MQTGSWNSCTNGGREQRDEALLGGWRKRNGDEKWDSSSVSQLLMELCTIPVLLRLFSSMSGIYC